MLVQRMPGYDQQLAANALSRNALSRYSLFLLSLSALPLPPPPPPPPPSLVCRSRYLLLFALSHSQL